MNCVIRTDASVAMGTGHVMRCLTLAEALRERGARVSFICRLLPGHLRDVIERRSFTVRGLPAGEVSLRRGGARLLYEQWVGVNWMSDAVQTMEVLRGLSGGTDWLVVDHYSLDRRWEVLVRPFVRRIMVVDDLANRPHLCDLLLDQNPSRNPARYDALVPPYCRKLLGPGYILLRPEFLAARRRLGSRDGKVRRILVFFGGSDSGRMTAKALEAIRRLSPAGVAVDVVPGIANAHREEIRTLCASLPGTRCHDDVDDVAVLMGGADLALGGGGMTMWERCFLGLPAIAVATSRCQEEAMEAVAAAGGVLFLGYREDVSADDLAAAMEKVLASPSILAEMGRSAVRLMGGAENKGGEPGAICTLMESAAGVKAV